MNDVSKIQAQKTQKIREPQETIEILANELAEIACQAVLSVADYLRLAARTTPGYSTKSNQHDPVTIHDRHVEHLLQQFLGTTIPGSRILGEEEGEKILNPTSSSRPTLTNTAGVTGLGQRVRWIVDPIDGTANFAAGLTYFGTSIGVELDGRIVAGAISVPCNREVFVANATEAWYIDEAGQKTFLHADGATAEANALISCYYPKTYFWEKYPQMALRHDLDLHRAYFVNRTLGAGAIDLALVAAGWVGVAVGISFKPWDVAAGIHLVRVAGGTVLNLNYKTNLPDGLRPVVVASGANFQAETAERITLEAIKTDWPELDVNQGG